MAKQPRKTSVPKSVVATVPTYVEPVTLPAMPTRREKIHSFADMINSGVKPRLSEQPLARVARHVLGQHNLAR